MDDNRTSPHPTEQQGEQGEQGEQGKRGEQGLRGLIGQVGLRGNQGNQGFEGNAGTPGPRGSQGPRGTSPVTLLGILFVLLVVAFAILVGRTQTNSGRIEQDRLQHNLDICEVKATDAERYNDLLQTLPNVDLDQVKVPDCSVLPQSD